MPSCHHYTNILKRLIQTFRDCSQSSNNNGYHLHFSRSPRRLYVILEILIFLNFFTFLWINSAVSWYGKIDYFTDSILLPHNNRSSSLYDVVALYVAVTQQFDLICRQHSLRLVLVPFVCPVQPIHTTQFPVTHSGDIVVSLLILFLRKFAEQKNNNK